MASDVESGKGVQRRASKPSTAAAARVQRAAHASPALSRQAGPSDKPDMTNNVSIMVAILCMFVMASLYVMRRRTRMGKRTPKF